MLARNSERLAELEARIPGARAYPCDVADLDRLGAVVERVEAELGAPHVLFHKAVAATLARIFEAKVADVERNFRVNTTSLFFLARASVGCGFTAARDSYYGEERTIIMERRLAP